MRHVNTRRKVAVALAAAGFIAGPTLVSASPEEQAAPLSDPTASVDDSVYQDAQVEADIYQSAWSNTGDELAGEHHRSVQRRLPGGRVRRRRRRGLCDDR